MGLTKEMMNFSLAMLVLLLMLLFTFIFIGIKAFAIPGTFGSIVNSIIPIAGGSGLAKGFSKNEKTLLDPVKVK